MDAFAVSVACGFAMRPCRLGMAFRLAFSFGLFQCIMPLGGWGVGVSLRRIIESCDHWIAFGLLSIIGARMIYESFKGHGAGTGAAYLSLAGLLALSVATSIDALAVGVSFAFLDTGIVQPALIIGVTTFALCFAGVWLGGRFGHFFENKLEAAGGLVLIGISVKILYSHLAG